MFLPSGSRQGEAVSVYRVRGAFDRYPWANCTPAAMNELFLYVTLPRFRTVLVYRADGTDYYTIVTR